MYQWKIVEIIPFRVRVEYFLAHLPVKALIIATWMVLVASIVHMSWPVKAQSLQNTNPEIMIARIHQLELCQYELLKQIKGLQEGGK